MARPFAQAAGLPGFQQNKTYAAHRVWKGSARGEIKTQPLTRQQAARLYHDARRFERQTRGRMESAYRPGKISTREGKLGNAGLAVLQALLFDFLNPKTGAMYPSYEAIAAAANVSRATVGRALARLKAAGVLNWIPRCELGEGPEGGFLMRQISNLYGVAPAGQWRGFNKAPDPPPPEAATWGAQPPTSAADGFAQAGAKGAQPYLEQDSSPVSQALARIGKKLFP